MNVYLDYNGSAPLSSGVEKFLKTRIDNKGPYANPEANHYLGFKCNMGIEKTRGIVAKYFNQDKSKVF